MYSTEIFNSYLMLLSSPSPSTKEIFKLYFIMVIVHSPASSSSLSPSDGVIMHTHAPRRVVYIFSDHDTDELTKTLLYSCETQRTVILDMSENGKRIERIQSMDADWQATGGRVRDAPRLPDIGEELGMMLEIRGVEMKLYGGDEQFAAEEDLHTLTELFNARMGLLEMADAVMRCKSRSKVGRRRQIRVRIWVLQRKEDLGHWKGMHRCLRRVRSGRSWKDGVGPDYKDYGRTQAQDIGRGNTGSWRVVKKRRAGFVCRNTFDVEVAV